MSQVRTGHFTVNAAGVQQNLNLGFIPDRFYMRNDTIFTSGTVTGVVEAWYDTYTASLTTPYTVIDTATTGTPLYSRLASGTVAACTGILGYQTPDSLLYVPNSPTASLVAVYQANQSTNLTITGISQATNASITATHSFQASDIGVTVVTFHNVVGMTQINTLSGVIQSVTSTTSFTVNINTSNFSPWISGGQANVITGAPTNTLYGNVSLPTAEANLGFIGVILGTSLMVNTSDEWSYTAILNYPGLC